VAALVVDTARRVLAYTGGTLVMGLSTFRLAYLESYARAARAWLHDEAEVIDTTPLTPGQAARQVADAVGT
jgi:hypothetical protein